MKVGIPQNIDNDLFIVFSIGKNNKKVEIIE